MVHLVFFIEFMFYTSYHRSMRKSIYAKGLNFYVSESIFMMETIRPLRRNVLFQSRPFNHGCFWLVYYVLFSLVWASPERGYYISFYLEFVLMPLRILASYCMMYMLIPAFLNNRKLLVFIGSYLFLLAVSGALQMLIGHFFYQQLTGSVEGVSFSITSWVRNIVLINSTIILLGAAKVIQLHFQLLDLVALAEEKKRRNTNEKTDQIIEVKSNRRIYRLRLDEVMYVEGMGNYITYVNIDRDRIIVYSSLKAAQAQLSDSFIRLHRSYLVNRKHINAYDKDTVTIGSKTIPRGKDVTDDMLK